MAPRNPLPSPSPSPSSSASPVSKRRKVTEADAEPTPAAWWEENRVALTGWPRAQWNAYEEFAKAPFPKRLRRYISKKFEKPTPVQAVAWPLVFAERKDVIAIAKTGSGKTLAFALPFLALSDKGLLDVYEPGNTPRMLVLAPTRELAMQIEEVCREFAEVCKGDYPTQVILGGMPKKDQLRQIRTRGLDICVATPGRLVDLCNDEALELGYVQFLVLDEADRMLDMGFIDEVRSIVGRTPKERQTVLFSATWPPQVHNLARELTKKDAVQIRVGQDTEDGAEKGSLKLNDRIHQTIHVLKDAKDKWGLLTKLLDNHWGKKILVFALYKKEAARLESWLWSAGYTCQALQGDMSQEKRTKAIEDFKSGRVMLLIATDVAARGLDVPNIDLVLNYTFPLTVEDFVHRCGRTGRGNKTGVAITFFNEEGDHKEKEHAFDLCRVLEGAKQQIPPELALLNKNTFSATKKKAHPVYGNFFKSASEMAKLEAQRVHTTFNDSDEEA